MRKGILSCAPQHRRDRIDDGGVILKIGNNKPETMITVTTRIKQLLHANKKKEENNNQYTNNMFSSDAVLSACHEQQ